ncbi:MAG: sensor domain-containing diguanylate cyclase [bacterium]
MPLHDQEPRPQPETRELMACLEVGKLLTSTLELREILRLIMDRMNELYPAQNWSLLLRDETTGDLHFEAVAGLEKQQVEGIRLRRGEGIAGHVAETGQAVFVPDAKKDPRHSGRVDETTGFRTHSILCVPLKTHGKVVGVIEVVNPKHEAIRAWEDLPVLAILADYAAIAIENSRLVAEIQRKCITDDYTDLYNARYLHETLDVLIRGAQEQGKGFAVVFVDIDNFKGVVDTHGHLLGSQVLKEVGQTILSCLSPNDILTKYGGDEFVILLPDRSREEALSLTERILQDMRQSTYLNSEPGPVRVTASFGIARFPEDASTKKDILLRADTAMYLIKKSTKNGVALIT